MWQGKDLEKDRLPLFFPGKLRYKFRFKKNYVTNKTLEWRAYKKFPECELRKEIIYL